MRSTKLLEKILSNVHAMLHYAADDLTEQEWGTRIAPGQNMLGYIVWHSPRVQDNIIQIWIRGRPELAHSERWGHWEAFRHLGCGVGISLAEADEIALGVEKADVLAYADAVHQETRAWLQELSDDDLDRVPEAQINLSSYAEYQTPGFHEDTDSLLGQPIWGLLMRPCIGHVHRHIGELMTAKDVIRASQ
jgi:hypothetical protein